MQRAASLQARRWRDGVVVVVVWWLAGFLWPTVCIVVFACLSAIASTMLVDAMLSVPNNSKVGTGALCRRRLPLHVLTAALLCSALLCSAVCAQFERRMEYTTLVQHYYK
jgi:hypothetical protein